MMNRRDASILVVDDTPENLRLLVRALSGAGYRVRAAPSGEIALRMARNEHPDLVLLDVDMPIMNGFQVCELLRADEALARIPVLFISAMHDAESKVKAFRAGGRDFVTKPFNIDEVLARVATHVDLRRLEIAMHKQNTELERIVAAQVHEISEAQIATIVALARLSESRDDNTGMHVERIGQLSQVIARSLMAREGSASKLTEESIHVIGKAATLHDIGKVGIPDAILLKPGKLTAEEFTIMKTHTTIGAATLDAVHQSYPRNELVRVGADIARSHHEKWDGSGYPSGLSNTSIPLSARIVAAADVYDAIRASRPYKPSQPHEAAAQALRDGYGKHFDPSVIDAFNDVEAEITEVWHALQTRQESRLEIA